MRRTTAPVVLLCGIFSLSAWSADESEEDRVKKTITSYITDQRRFPPIEEESDSGIYTRCKSPVIGSQLETCLTISLGEEGDIGKKETVLEGIDKRIKVKKTKDWPHSVHGLIMAIFGEHEKQYGSGTLIAPNLVLTAAHNIYSDCIGQAATKVEFFPAMHGVDCPFGAHEIEDGYFFYPVEYLKDKREDYALLVLKKPVIETGYFGISVLRPDQLNGLTINVTGYPTDKVIREKRIEAGKKEKYTLRTMWGMEGSVEKVDQGVIQYKIDTSNGQSGSGVWYKKGDDYFVTGVHVEGKPTHNEATLLTKARYNRIRGWITESVQKLIKETLAANPTITSLSFYEHVMLIGDEGAKMLAANTTLTSLDLRANQITDEGAKALAANKTLTHLDLSGNKVADEGAKALAANKTLTSLDLSSNYIRDEGAKALAANKTLSLLDLRWNEVTTEVVSPPDWWELFNHYGGGVMYRHKPGVLETDPKALEWLTYAANHGYKGAIDYLKEMKILPSNLPTYAYPFLITCGHEKIYQRFLNGALIYTDPKTKSKITLPIRDLSDPLEGTFDLSRCGDVGKYLSIATGYKKGTKPENKYKVEIWFAPKFLIEKELKGAAAHFKPIMSNWKMEAPVGILWTWANDDLKYYDYLTTKNMDDLSKNNLYENWFVGPREALAWLATEWWGSARALGGPASSRAFMLCF